MNVVVFTGAGISRESGLRTFRDSEDGLWEGYDVREVASLAGWWADPDKVQDFYNIRRREVIVAEPNDAHRAIAELEKKHRVAVITQNIDDLHERAGSTQVIHLHGEVRKVRPVDDESRLIPWDDDLHMGDLEPISGVQLRPHVVWFGEGLPELDRAMRLALSPTVNALIVVGTSLNVYPAAFIATESVAARVYVIDPNPPELKLDNVRVVCESATAGVRQVVNELLDE